MIFTLVLRSLLIYFVVLFLFRMMGKRQLGEMQPYELVITLIIADLSTIPMSDTALPLSHGIIPIIIIAILHFILAYLSRKSMIARRLINGSSILVINQDGVDYKALKKMNMNFNDLLENLRTAGYFNLEEILYAIIQTNGSVAVLPRSKYDSVTPDDINIKKKENTLPVIILAEGKFINENLAMTKINKTQINSFLTKNKIKNIKNIELITINNNGLLYIKQKSLPFITLQFKDFGGEW